MKVTLINPPIDTKYRSWFPLGIGYIASVLREKGHEVELIDLIGTRISRAEFKEIVKNLKTDCIGMGGIVTAFNNAVDIVKYIREVHPDVFIFAGNTVAYTIPEILMKETSINAVICGEGELTVPDLVDACQEKRDLRQVKGIIFRDKSGELITTEKREPIANIDTIPYPAWDLMPMETYFKNANHRYCVISTVRGCPYNCGYCCKTFMDYKVRYRSAKSILEELLEFHKRYNISCFYFWDDISTINKERILEFCKLKMESELAPMEWNLAARANLIDEDIIIALKESNSKRIGFGIESMNQGVLDSINKRISVNDTIKALDLCKKHGLDYNASSFMVGAVNETHATIRQTHNFCKKYKLKYEPHFMTPLPGTELYRYALKEGLIKDELDYLRRLSKQGNTDFLLVNVCKNLTDEQLTNLRYKYLYYPVPKKLYDGRNVGQKIIDKLRGKKINQYRDYFNRYDNIWD